MAIINTTEIESVSAESFTGSTNVNIVRLENKLLQVFSNGSALDTRRLPADMKRGFRSELSHRIALSCADMFDTEGSLLNEHRYEWRNIEEIVPTVVSILTARDNYVQRVEPSQAIEVVRFCIEAARNPDIWTHTTFSTGFGGSADSTTSARLPAYGLSALSVVQGLRQFYTQREQQALQRAKGSNTGDITTLRQQFAIPGALPKIQFFFADHAAMVINHESMLPHEIDERTRANKVVLETFVVEHFSDISDLVEYSRDRGIDETELEYWQREYCRYLLETTKDESIQAIITSLQKTGSGVGGDHGRHNAALYAAIHQFVFQRQLALPPTDSLFTFYDTEPVESVTKPYAHIIIGGESEERFLRVEEYLSQTATAEGFLTFLQMQHNQRREHAATIKAHMATTQTWMMESSRTLNLPHHTIAIITSIGSGRPTYYKTEYDIDYGNSIQSHIEKLRVAIQSSRDTATRKQIEGALRDYEALVRVGVK